MTTIGPRDILHSIAGRAPLWIAAVGLAGILVGGSVIGGSVVGGSGGTLRAEFATPVLVTDGSGGATQTATGLDLANNAYISSVINEKIRVTIIGPNVNVDAPILATGLGQGDPDFATSSRAVTYLSFSQLDERFVGEGREIYYTHNEGGLFGAPRRITSNRVDDFASRLVLDPDGSPHLAWSRRIGEETRVVYWHTLMAPGEEVIVTRGEYPAIFVDGSNNVHLVYSRDNDLHYAMGKDGVFPTEKRVTTTPLEPETSVHLGVDPSGNVLASYESRHSLYFVWKPVFSLGFIPPRLLDRGNVLQPKMRVRREGQVTIVYEKAGDIWLVQGQSASLNVPVQITSTPEVESSPSLEVDRSNNIHLSYIRDGEVYYTHNAATPQADFTAVPSIGEGPLTVQFADLSSGPIQLWRWDLGDGSVSTLRNPKHVYPTPGKYTVTLRVGGPGATSSERVREDFIWVQDPYNTLRIPDQLVFPGQKDIWFPVLASHREAIQAFQLMGTFDSNVLRFRRHELLFSALASIGPELLIVNDKDVLFEVGCIFDYDPPFDKGQLVPGENQTLINLIFDVAGGAPQGAETQITLVNNKDLSQIFNIFTVSGFTKIPALTPSTVRILRVEPPYPRFFLRGDVDGSESVDITDAIRLLNYLFLGSEAPPCLDAADVMDVGRVDISGAISLLNYLFLGGSQPAVPYPMTGLDPTEDTLGTCY